MTSILGRIFHHRKPVKADPYETAMRESDQLIEKLRESAASPDPVRQTIGELWRHRMNTPFVVTIHETAQEMIAPLKQHG